jgi:copper chaperone CopZ
MMDVRPALVLVTALLVACGTAPAHLPPPRVVGYAQAPADLELGQDEISMEVLELMCSPCAAQIVGQSRRLDGVTHVSMLLASKTLTVRFDTRITLRERVIASVEQIVANIQ